MDFLRGHRYRKERLRMVDEQIRRRGVADPRVLSAMAEIPRHEFVPGELRDEAYEDRALPIGFRQTISQPFMVALMTERLAPAPGDRVLEIGTGSGYQAAVLSRLCREVFTIERIGPLRREARERFGRLGLDNIRVFGGDGSEGLAAEAPFDGVIVTAAAPAAPRPLLEQLAEGGRLVVPVGSRLSQVLACYTRRKGRFERADSTPCVFVPLVGRHGYGEGEETEP